MAAQLRGRVNLLPTDRFEYSKIGRFLGWALTTGRYLVVLTELVVISAFLSRFWFDRTLNDLREARVQKEAVVDSFQDIQREFLRAQAQLSAIKKVLEQQYGVSDQLSQLQGVTPGGIEYKELLVSSDSATLKGFAASSQTFSALLSSLEATEGVRGVDLKLLQLSETRAPGFDFEVEVVTHDL